MSARIINRIRYAIAMILREHGRCWADLVYWADLETLDLQDVGIHRDSCGYCRIIDDQPASDNSGCEPPAAAAGPEMG